MKRDRGWGKGDTLSSHLGTANTTFVEEIVGNGSKTIVEIGAGSFEAARALAAMNGSNTIIAIEPYITQGTDQNLPPNLQIIAQPAEDINQELLPPNTVDLVISGGYEFNYVQDKLLFLRRVHAMLKPGSQAFIEFMGNPTHPSLYQLISQFQLSNQLIVTNEDGITILTITKQSDEMTFGRYSYKLIDQGSGKTQTAYTFPT